MSSNHTFSFVCMPGHKTLRYPMLCVLPLFSMAAAIVLITISTYPSYQNTPAIFSGAAVTTFLIGILGSQVGIYRMARELKRLRYPNIRRAQRIGAGLIGSVTYVLPPVALIYFRRSLSQIWAENTSNIPKQLTDTQSHTHADAAADSGNSWLLGHFIDACSRPAFHRGPWGQVGSSPSRDGAREPDS